MRLWIVGGEGMLGSAFRRICQKRGIDFIVTGREVDIRDLKVVETFAKLQPFTHVINCAAFTDVDGAESHVEAAYALNLNGVKHLLHCNKPLVTFSTDYVFDGKKRGGYSEKDPCHPLNVYGKTKWESEKICREALVLRTSWLFGLEGMDFPKKIRKLIREKKQLNVVDDQRGRPTFCDDIVDVALQMLGEKGLYHVANEGETTWYAWAKLLREVEGRGAEILPCKAKDFPRPARRPENSVLDTSKLGIQLPHWEERAACLSVF